jgi:MFS family permease
MARAVSARVGLYFGLLQLVFGLTWVGYVIYLPQLAAQAGISRGAVGWILVLDQVIFALCDWAVGIAVDRVAKVVGRVAKVVVGATAMSGLAFLLLPFVARFGTPEFVFLIVVWAITSSALRAPPLALLGRYTPVGQQPWVGSFFVVGAGLATASTPYLAGRITAYDPRIFFVASALSVLAITVTTVWAEKTLERAATPDNNPPSSQIRMASFAVFLVAVLLLQIGFQVHSAINAQPLFSKYARPSQLPILLSLFWVGFTLLTPLASLLAKRLGPMACVVTGASVAAGSAWVAARATNIVSLSSAQFICGGAWGAVMVGAVAAAFAIGRNGRAGTAAGGFFFVVALATMARIALVTTHADKVPALASAWPWLPTVSWLAAALLLLAVAVTRRREAHPPTSAAPTPRPAVDRTAPGPRGHG